jgi:hypothetical protein
MSVTNIETEDPTVANRYLAGQLTDAERVTFEAELERNPHTLRELEATARLKVGLEKLRETGELREELRRSPPWRHPLFLAVAATFAAFVVGFSLFRGDISRDTPPLLAASATSFVDQRGSVLPVAGTFAVFRKRVDAYDAVIELPQTRQAIELRVLPQAAAQSGRYRVSLSRMRDDDSLQRIASLPDLRPGGDGFVTVFADTSRLTPGRYRLVVFDNGEGDTPADSDSFLLRMVPSPSR